MDLREQLLPNEKLLKEYTNLFVENKKGNAYLTNRRIFLSTKNNLWNFNTDDIRYMGRMNKPRFSWIWQVLISLMILYSILGGYTLTISSLYNPLCSKAISQNRLFRNRSGE